MKRAFSRILFLLAMVIACWWGWRVFFPTAEQIIRKRLSALAQAVTSPSNESALAKAYNSQKLADFFAPDAQISIDISGRHLIITGRDEILQAAMMARSQPGRYKVEFGGVTVDVAPDNSSALVQLTAKVTVSGEPDWIPQELKVAFQKTDGNWLISRLETVKTLL
jgi:hypothetical protein